MCLVQETVLQFILLSSCSRLRKLDALFSSNPMLPTYVRKFEFGNIQSKLLWFTGEPLARTLNSLTQPKIFLITGPYPNMDWDEFDEEVKVACIRLAGAGNLEMSNGFHHRGSTDYLAVPPRRSDDRWGPSSVCPLRASTPPGFKDSDLSIMRWNTAITFAANFSAGL